MIIPVTEDEKIRLAQAVWFMWDIMERIEDKPEVNRIWETLDEAVCLLRAIEDGTDW